MLWTVATLVAGLTAFYMFRQVFMVFFGECRADHDTQHHLHESPPSMTMPLWILAVGSIVVGYFGVPHSLGGFLGIPHVFNDWLAPVMGAHGVENEGHPAGGELALELGLMAISVTVAFCGIGLAYLMYYRRSLKPDTFSELAGGAPYRVLLNKYYVDELYDLVFVRGMLVVANAAAWFDRTIIDGIVNGAAVVVRGVSQVGGMIDKYIVDGAVNGVADVTWAIGRRARTLQTGAITSYVYVVVIGVLGGVFLYWSWASAY
jgi:NADH-quinone oxidoreductase subunit L